jgi:hypothetical protein
MSPAEINETDQLIAHDAFVVFVIPGQQQSDYENGTSRRTLGGVSVSPMS